MNIKALREWLFTNSKEDQWWLYADGVTETNPVTLSIVEDFLQSGDYSEIKVIHTSQVNLDPAPWVAVEEQAVQAPPAVPQPALPTGIPTRPPHSPGINHESGQSNFALIAVIVPFIASIFMIVRLPGMALIQDPAGTLTTVSWLSTLGVAILVGLDGSQLGVGKDPSKGKTSATMWGILTFLLYVPCFVLYLNHRRKYDSKNLALIGLLGILVQLGLVWYYYSMIEEAKESIRDALRGSMY